MPNWCINNLNISGNEKQLQKFVEKSMSTYDDGTERFIFNGTHPMPNTLNITSGTHLSFIEKIKRYINIKLYKHKDWYGWRLSNWGTKWDACEPYINNNDINYFSVSFDTAWGPPINWLDNIAMDYPDLSFELEYEESGMGFGGTFTIQGNDKQDAQWDLESASECCEGPINWEHKKLEQQCLICGEETETISMNVADIKPAKIKINESNEN